MIYFAGLSINNLCAAPFTLPYRNPTRAELENNQSIMFSSEPITESDIFIERAVLQFLVTNNFFQQRHLDQWIRLSRLSILTARQAIRMTRLKRREATALRRFQRANNLPVTGIIDTPVIQIVFPITCGTPDFVEEPFDDGFGDVDLDEESTTSLKKRATSLLNSI